MNEIEKKNRLSIKKKSGSPPLMKCRYSPRRVNFLMTKIFKAQKVAKILEFYDRKIKPKIFVRKEEKIRCKVDFSKFCYSRSIHDHILQHV